MQPTIENRQLTMHFKQQRIDQSVVAGNSFGPTCIRWLNSAVDGHKSYAANKQPL